MFFSPTFAFSPALIGRFFIPELRDFVKRNAQQTCLPEHLGQTLLHKLALVRPQYALSGIGTDKIADTALLIDNFFSLQQFHSPKDGVVVHLEGLGQITYARDAILAVVFSFENLFAYLICQFAENGFLLRRYHRFRSLWSQTARRLKQY